MATKLSACQSLLLPLLLLLLLISFTATPQVQAQTARRKLNSSVSAIFVFGDSTVDPGNNNYLATTFKSNFPPYGRDLYDHQPTGRFTNGKLTTDFIAAFLGLKEEVPAYLDPSLGAEELMTGVSFASAGSGFDPLTAELSGVIPMIQQLNNFKDYLIKLQLMIGTKKSKDIMERALVVVSAGTNDFVANYISLPFRSKSFSIEDYQAFLLEQVEEFLQVLYSLGAQRVVVVGIPPIGCLPIVITLFGNDGLQERSCIDVYNSLAIDYNNKLQLVLKRSSNLNRRRILYMDAYKTLLNPILFPLKYGFEESTEGCCGTGLIELAFLCNTKSIVCSNSSKYIFWDSIHPTEEAYFFIVKSLWPTIDHWLKNY